MKYAILIETPNPKWDPETDPPEARSSFEPTGDVYDDTQPEPVEGEEPVTAPTIGQHLDALQAEHGACFAATAVDAGSKPRKAKP